MGLDSVELVFAVEEHFGVDILNSEAERIFTVGDLHQSVVAKLRSKGQSQLSDAKVFEELRDVICNQTGVDPNRVAPEARIVADLGID